VPGWFVGEAQGREFEGLRARLDAEREGGAGGGVATGMLAGEAAGAGEARRRTLGEVVVEQFRGRG